MHIISNQGKLIAILGLAQKAGKVISGDYAINKAIRTGVIKILLIASDASENTKKSYRDMANHYEVGFFEILSKEQLGTSIGKARRAAVAITDVGFGVTIKKLCLDNDE